MSLLSALSFATLLFTIAKGQQSVWQQCGGIGWAGGTACGFGLVCNTYNAYYSQCIPGTATTSTPPETTSDPATTVSSVPTSVPSKAPSGPAPNYWFSFGDSYTQTGFLDNETLPAPGNPLGNPPYPGYTAVGGTNWIDVDTIVYNKSLILTYNYAYGGATIDANLVQPYEPTVLSLIDQVNEFLGTVANKPATTPWESSNSLFSFWIGINDIGNSYYESGNRSAFSETLLDAYFTLVNDVTECPISNVGARNFLFINVPPVNVSPLMLAEPVSAQQLEGQVIADFNTRLENRITQLKANHSDVTTFLWDSNSAFTKVLASPTTYGFVDNTSYGNAGDFWGNNYHSSSDAQTIWGQGVAAVLADTVW